MFPFLSRALLALSTNFSSASLLEINMDRIVRPGGDSWFMCDLHRQSIAPAVLLSRKLSGMKICLQILLWIEYPSCSSPLVTANSHVNQRIRLDVLDPLRFESVFGQDVDPAFRFDEPDLDFSRQARFAACCGDIGVLPGRHEVMRPVSAFRSHRAA